MTRKPTRKQPAADDAAEDAALPSRPNTPQPPAPLTPEQIEEHLAFIASDMMARRDELVDALKKTAAAYPTLSDDEGLEVCMENIRMAKALERRSDDVRKVEKDPFLNGGRTVDAFFKRFASPLMTAMDPVSRAMNAYAADKARIAREEAERLAQEARDRAERAAEDARRAMEQNAPDVDAALEQAGQTAAEAEKAGDRAEGRVSSLTQTRSMFGGVASVRETWGWELEDISIVPAAYLMVNPDMVKAAAKQRDASGRPTLTIPGIKWVSQTKMGVR